jgi:hypothetical protein
LGHAVAGELMSDQPKVRTKLWAGLSRIAAVIAFFGLAWLLLVAVLTYPSWLSIDHSIAYFLIAPAVMAISCTVPTND